MAATATWVTDEWRGEPSKEAKDAEERGRTEGTKGRSIQRAIPAGHHRSNNEPSLRGMG
jgi:hypothetical protein